MGCNPQPVPGPDTAPGEVCGWPREARGASTSIRATMHALSQRCGSPNSRSIPGGYDSNPCEERRDRSPAERLPGSAPQIVSRFQLPSLYTSRCLQTEADWREGSTSSSSVEEPQAASSPPVCRLPLRARSSFLSRSQASGHSAPGHGTIMDEERSAARGYDSPSPAQCHPCSESGTQNQPPAIDRAQRGGSLGSAPPRSCG